MLAGSKSSLDYKSWRFRYPSPTCYWKGKVQVTGMLWNLAQLIFSDPKTVWGWNDRDVSRQACGAMTDVQSRNDIVFYHFCRFSLLSVPFDSHVSKLTLGNSESDCLQHHKWTMVNCKLVSVTIFHAQGRVQFTVCFSGRSVYLHFVCCIFVLFCFYLNHAVYIIRSYPVKNSNCSVYSLKYILFQNIYLIYNM